MNTARIIEIFSSIQGEGPYVGKQMTFVRFQDCEFSCKFCDTPLSFVENKDCRVEWPPFTGKFEKQPNPVSMNQLNHFLSRFSDPVISLTGGEPLQKTDFIARWLDATEITKKILLETAGIHWQQLLKIIDKIDIISMDFKLSSSTGMKSYWEEHERFLTVAKAKEVYIKIVVTEETTESDIEKAIRLIQKVDPLVPCILQPASPFRSFTQKPSPDLLKKYAGQVRKTLGSVRIIPQIHKQLGVL